MPGDPTASKIPSGYGGFGAFCSPSGYGLVVCCPCVVLNLILTPILEKRERKKLEREDAEAARANATAAREDPPKKTTKQVDASSASKDETSTEPHEKKVPEAPELDEKMKRHPDNPRICDPECPGFGTDDCAVHNPRRLEPKRSASPGMLAV